MTDVTVTRETVYGLARLAECFAPDTDSSPGACLLLHVQDRLADAYEANPEAFLAGRGDDDGTIHEIADDAPDVYTRKRWEEFLDLGAYQEDPTELGFELGGKSGSTLVDAAGVCLYMIAERLCHALIAQWNDEQEALLDSVEGEE